MNILITGAGGFIGKHLGNALKQNHNIINIYNGDLFVKNYLNYSCDLLNTNHINSFLSENLDIDIIIHTASKLGASRDNEELSIFYENIKMYDNLAIIIKHFKPFKVINFSSIAVYPNKNGHYFEDSEIRPSVNTEGMYGLSKFCGENILDFLHKQFKIVHLRIAQVYGEGMREDRIFKVMQQELKQTNIITVFAEGLRVSNFIHIDTLIEKVILFINCEVSGIFNIGEKNLSYKDLALNIIELYGNSDSKINLIKEGVSSKCYINTDKLKEFESKCMSGDNDEQAK